MNKFITLLVLVFFAQSIWAVEKSSNKRRLKDKELISNPIKSNVKPERSATTHGHVSDRSTTLHKHALKAFIEGRYSESEANFSLAYKLWPDSRELVLDYALCSVLYPNAQKSYTRAKKLLENLKSSRPNAHAHFVRGLLLAESAEVPKAIEHLSKIHKGFLKKEAQRCISRLEKNIPIEFSIKQLKHIFRYSAKQKTRRRLN